MSRRGPHKPTPQLAAARAYVAAGISVIPIARDGTKAPSVADLPREPDPDRPDRFKPTWKPYQTRLPTDDELVRWFARDNPAGVAVVNGQISRGRFTVDLDDPRLVRPFNAALEKKAPGLRARLCEVRTPRPGGGRHLHGRTPATVKCDKLARARGTDGKVVTLIEVKGEGGYALLPGSPPECHPERGEYTHAGGPPLAELPELHPDEVSALFDVARRFDRLNDAAPARANGKPKPPTGPAGGEDVFEAYNRSVGLADVVGWHENKGHRVTRRSDERVGFVRDGKKGGQSFNVRLFNGAPVTYNFSTNAGMPTGKGLSPSQVRCLYETGSCDTAAMSRFAEVLRRELGWPDPRANGTHRGGPPSSNGGAPSAGEQAAGEQAAPQSGCQIILDYFRRRYQPRFRRGSAVHCADGRDVPMGEATAVPDSALIEALAKASDAPRFPGAGGVKVQSLPAFFKTWSRVAWGDLLALLPDEDAAELAGDEPAAEEFRRLVREALLSEVALGEKIGDGGLTVVQRRSLVGWCQTFAKVGPWRDVRGKRCWCKYRQTDGGELVLMVAVRHELFAQVGADRRLREMGANTFTRRAARYGVGRSSRDDRPHGLSAVVLDEQLVDDLLADIPDDPDLAAEEKPSG